MVKILAYTRYFVGLLTIIILTGCSSSDFYCKYVIPLKTVERSPVCKDYKITHESYMYKYNDELVEVGLYMAEYIEIAVMNKTEQSIKILWDETLYVDQNGKNQKVMHMGQKRLLEWLKDIDKNALQPPTVIVKGGNITDQIVPKNTIYYRSGEYGGWSKEPLFPIHGKNYADALAKANKCIGSKVKIIIPFVIGDHKYEYIFSFEVESATVEEVKSDPFGYLRTGN